MKTNLLKFSIFAIIFIALVSCTSTSTSKLISIEDYTFARTDDSGQLVTIDDAVYQRGEKVSLVLLNVGPFKEDSEGLNWFDLDMEIIGPDGAVVLSETGLLGDGGHLDLENNRASSPYGSYTSTTELQPGAYKFKMTIYDKIGKGTATQTASFKLE